MTVGRYKAFAVLQLLLSGLLAGLGIAAIVADGPPVVVLNLPLAVLMGAIGTMNVGNAVRQARLDELRRTVGDDPSQTEG